MPATAAIIKISRLSDASPILFSEDTATIFIRAGVSIEIAGTAYKFENDTPVDLSNLKTAGIDYAVTLSPDGAPFVVPVTAANPITDGHFAGFHYAAGGHATGKEGGSTTPSINPFSVWDLDYRPKAADPRGMAVINAYTSPVWVDIYLLGVDHDKHGTSRAGALIADGADLPNKPDGTGRYKRLDYATAAEIYAHHGKRLLTAEEFFAAAYGVKERCSRSDEPKQTGEMIDSAERFISRYGLFDATGTMWQWGTDGHPDDPRPSLFGGSWINGSDAGSRFAILDPWAGSSDGGLSARGASDHLIPA